MTSNKWLEVMMQAKDFPKGMEKLIREYGMMLLEENKVSIIPKVEGTDKAIEYVREHAQLSEGWIPITNEERRFEIKYPNSEKRAWIKSWCDTLGQYTRLYRKTKKG